jgi:hypothetical protein
MSISGNSLRAIAATVAISAVLASGSSSLAQAGRQGGAPVSVLPTGWGKALLDTSDTVFLLLDH